MTTFGKKELINMQFRLQDLHYKKHFPNSEYFVILNKGQKIGRLYIEEKRNEFHIIDITIQDIYRNLGYGSIALQHIIDKAVKKNKHVSLHVDKRNQAIRLYKRLGFVISGGSELFHNMRLSPKSEIRHVMVNSQLQIN